MEHTDLVPEGTKLLIVHKKMYPQDIGRFFVGVAAKSSGKFLVITGNTWIQDSTTSVFMKKGDARCKLLSLDSSSLIFYLLPTNTNLQDLRFNHEAGKKVLLTDGAEFQMDLGENQISSS